MANWTGERLKVTGIRNGRPVSEPIGPWQIELHPDPKENAVEIKGLLFAKNMAVRLDMDADLLAINGELFKGRKITGKSPLFGETAFKGVAFEREDGKVFGKAAILILEDGRVAMDFDKVVVGDNRAREYGVLLGAKR